ncbi:prolipoprotein diacylglyceryl transferase [Wenzhouxiangella sp. XN79A]|uniref:prolipoprotein diacylglyceryl transferase n=1 Tax=Wenzhouxiangella sp. XN79A TaxID=2724193 RepID=UPI00144AC135|nr:prolipoprotein diacylglyceryl transferase [Wenzhouxiangella sp. XN79A]NKI36503.1 prolipoprotein diacylglyceryl transferase [Wenzhouxiangella sp. XN79A]
MSLPYLVDFDPVALDLGMIQVHWYGITYLLAFASAWALLRHRARQPHWPIEPVQVGDYLFWGIVGVIAGGRLGYVLFYGLDRWADDLLFPFKLQDGGMSFHGGLVGVLVAMALYARHLGIGFLKLGDFTAQVVPLGLAFGRIGNFIGGELWGRVSDAPWAMVFPAALDRAYSSPAALEAAWRAGELSDQARHPSQLYQAALEGLLLFAIVWIFARKPRPTGAVGGLFLVGYALFRIFAEWFREPDAHLGFVAFQALTMGMLLSLPMLAAGVALLVYAYRKSA